MPIKETELRFKCISYTNKRGKEVIKKKPKTTETTVVLTTTNAHVHNLLISVKAECDFAFKVLFHKRGLRTQKNLRNLLIALENCIDYVKKNSELQGLLKPFTKYRST